jgi:Reverse transcriptase (RNA-dependent DNA polymerase)
MYSAVANEMTFRMILIAMLIWKLASLIFDVETAFLHGDLTIPIYMDCPAGMEHEDDECLLWNKTIYWLVQSARMYYEKFSKIMMGFGFERSAADPCLFVRYNRNGKCYVLCYVDDNLVVGHPAAIKELMEQLKTSEPTVLSRTS